MEQGCSIEIIYKDPAWRSSNFIWVCLLKVNQMLLWNFWWKMDFWRLWWKMNGMLPWKLWLKLTKMPFWKIWWKTDFIWILTLLTWNDKSNSLNHKLNNSATSFKSTYNHCYCAIHKHLRIHYQPYYSKTRPFSASYIH